MGENKGLTAYELKVIAVVAMTIDHLAWAFVPAYTPAGQLLHALGRLTAPIMCYFLAEGYVHTRNVKKYMVRLGCFAVISEPAFNYYMTGFRRFESMGMIYTLFLALIALRVYDSGLIGRYRALLIVVLIAASLLGDWPCVGVIWPLVFYIYRDYPQMQFKMFSFLTIIFVVLLNVSSAISTPQHPYISMCQFGLLLAPSLLKRYNGRLGRDGQSAKRGGKWFFYIYYPAHLVIIRLALEAVNAIKTA